MQRPLTIFRTILLSTMVLTLFYGFMGALAPCRAALPAATINVDGEPEDWAGIAPLMVDAQGDSLAPHVPGTDLVQAYMAANPAGDTLFFRFDFTGGPGFTPCTGCGDPGAGSIEYLIGFDDPSIGSWNTWACDWQVGFDRKGFWIWDLRRERSYADRSNLSVYSQNLLIYCGSVPILRRDLRATHRMETTALG